MSPLARLPRFSGTALPNANVRLYAQPVTATGTATGPMVLVGQVQADVNGFYDGKNDGVQDEQYKDKTDADIVWRLDMIKELGVYPCQLAASSPRR